MNRFRVRLSLLIAGVVILTILPMLIFVEAIRGGEDKAEEDNFREEFGEVGHVTIPLLALTGFSLVIGVSAGVVISRELAKPIDALSAAAHRIGAGELGHQVTLARASRELHDLAVTFNAMSADLAQAEQLRRNLMADVSHELRTPLTVLEGHLRAALDDVYALDKAEIANLYNQTHHLIRLVEDLHLLAKAEAHQLPLNIGDTDVRQIAQEVIENFAVVAEEKQVRLTLDASPDLPPIRADQIRLRQVVVNLVDNALRYTPAGGTVTLEVAMDESKVLLRVRDTGIGIAPEHLPHVFDRFYRVDPSRARVSGGSGLGLAIVRALLEIQGATIEATSAGGTCFTIRFNR